jgi:hypothetical protein
MHRRQFTTLVLASAFFGPLAHAADTSATEGLVKVKSKRLKAVYLKPGADFRVYHKVMLDPTQVAFKKNWQRDYNSSTRAFRVTDADVQRAIDEGMVESSKVFAKAFTDGGWPVVTAPGHDVLKVRTGLVNIRPSAPDIQTAGRSRVYANEAGEATLIIDVWDSSTGTLLGRAFDARLAGDNTIMMMRNSVTNRADFRRLVEDWAKISVRGLNELKASSPVKA